tara:strand:+ start:389 stop:634 length:246 start_codon:yes stop_codon:yes gene_type:complete
MRGINLRANCLYFVEVKVAHASLAYDNANAPPKTHRAIGHEVKPLTPNRWFDAAIKLRQRHWTLSLRASSQVARSNYHPSS